MKWPGILRLMMLMCTACAFEVTGVLVQAAPQTSAPPSNAAAAHLHLYLEQAAEAMHQGDLASAAEKLRRALAIDPHSLAALNNLAIVLAREGKPAGAIPFYQQGAESASW